MAERDTRQGARPPRQAAPRKHAIPIHTPAGRSMQRGAKLQIDVLGMVKNLNESTTTLDEILVLRVLDGRDHFLPIHGRWLQSSLARSINKLTKTPEGGIRALQHQKPNSDVNVAKDKDKDKDKVRWSVPREIFR